MREPTEAQSTQKLLRHLRAAAPDAEIDKLNLRMGAGIPDVVATRKGRVTWIEVKRTATDPWRRCTPLQQRKLVRLRRAGAQVWLLSVSADGWALDTVTADPEVRLCGMRDVDVKTFAAALAERL